ncbi:MAG: AAA family ATPase, partial [Candidatus Kapaibacterium sp.]
MDKNVKDIEKIEQLAEAISKVKAELGKVIIGQKDIIDELLISLFAKGHCLLIGVPGLAKTLLISTLSRALDLKFSRIQFTPDLMPGDITGAEIIEDNVSTGQKQFRFIKGPVFANIVLADEINRTPPKTQAALLEAMQEHEVTAAGHTYTLEQPFFVLATQNPIEQEGTYPLPEAQLDRFFFKLLIDYPNMEEEREIVLKTTGREEQTIDSVLEPDDVLRLQNAVLDVPVPDNVLDNVIRLTAMSRPCSELAD